MGNSRNGIRALFVLLALLALGAAPVVHAVAQNNGDCADTGDGNGQGGGSGGAGGGCVPGGGGSGGNQPGQPGEPSNGNGPGGGGTGGNGANGDGGANNVPTPSPAPVAATTSSGGRSGGPVTRSASASASVTGPTDDRLAVWAKQFSTTPAEVQSWFGAFTPNDSIAGAARSIVVHPDDQVTVFAGERIGANDASVLRTGIEDLGDVSTKGGDTVEVSLHSTKVPLGTTVTESGGRFSATVRIPPSTQVGRHFIIALAPNTRQGRTAFVYPVTVATRQVAPPVVQNVEPTAGEPSRFPWLLVEAIVGSVLIVALFIARVRRAAATGV